MMAWITFILTFITAVCLIYQIWLSRIALTADVILKLLARFESPEMLIIRREAAKAFLAKNYRAVPNPAQDVLNFFETLGFLTNLKALDKRIVWNSFFSTIRGYWEAFEVGIKDRQKVDKTAWTETENLYNILNAIQKKKAKTSNVKLEKDELTSFFNREASL
jgi:hypothetical protein